MFTRYSAVYLLSATFASDDSTYVFKRGSVFRIFVPTSLDHVDKRSTEICNGRVWYNRSDWDAFTIADSIDYIYKYKSKSCIITYSRTMFYVSVEFAFR